MVTIEQGLYVRVQELPNGPTPFPTRSGFSTDVAYRVLGLYNPSETSDAYFVLSNDRDEIWFICNRHLRAVALNKSTLDFRVGLASFKRFTAASLPDPVKDEVLEAVL